MVTARVLAAELMKSSGMYESPINSAEMRRAFSIEPSSTTMSSTYMVRRKFGGRN